jgi:glycosyltransferase involved in cell wall biosynthesis
VNILFVLYGDLTSNSANPLALYAREFARAGHSCVVAIPGNLESISEHANAAFHAVLYGDVLRQPGAVFPNGLPVDVIHAWTPRENIRQFIAAYMAILPTPWVIYLEDHEAWIASRALALDDTALAQQTEQSLAERLPSALSHPFYYRDFIGLADAAVTIQGKLGVDVPAWVPCTTVLPGVDLDFFLPRAADPTLRARYGLADNQRAIVYPGGVNGFTRPGIEALCRAVGLINSQGYPCKLLRTGPFPLDFLDELPPQAKDAVVDLGVVPRADLPDLLALADVFVQPGKPDPFEDLRLPGKLPELLAMGRPVITPNTNIAHLFEDGVNAVLTHTGTAEEIAAKCIALFTNKHNAMQVGKAGRQLAEEHFDIKRQAARMLGVYRLACAQFDRSIASAVWQHAPETASVDLLLAKKLKLMADIPGNRSGLDGNALLQEHARLIEAKRLRVNGLERALSERVGQIIRVHEWLDERDAHIANLQQEVAHRDGHITNLQQEVAQRDGHIAKLQQAMTASEVSNETARKEIDAIRQSASWKLTLPLRWLGQWFH